MDLVPGYGPIPARVMLVGEAPGAEEVKEGRPFVGKAGRELTGYLSRAGIERSECYITNVVKERPPGNRTPTQREVEYWLPALLDEIEMVKPEIVGAIGRVAAEVFLGETVDMERVHGLVFERGGRLIVPCYHPASGLHNSSTMRRIERDFQVLGQVVRGVGEPHITTRDIDAEIRLASHTYLEFELPRTADEIAIDTEQLPDGRIISIQVALSPKEVAVVMTEDGHSVRLLREWIEDRNPLVVMHNALWDLRALHRLGIYPKRIADTMVAAHLLDKELSLKTLAYRELGLELDSYQEVVRKPGVAKQLSWLRQVAENLESSLPGRIVTYIKRLVREVETGKETDLLGRWHRYNGRQEVERIVGRMPENTLMDVGIDTFLRYAGGDAYATYILWQRFRQELARKDLDEVFWRDMGVLMLVVRMMERGILVDREWLTALGTKMQQELDSIRKRLAGEICQEDFNPASPQQVKALLKTFGVNIKSTEEKALARYKDKLPVVRDILRFRHLSKLKRTYIDALLSKADRSGRVHTDFTLVRTETGRLASRNPNLQNIPVRTADGKDIRRAFVAAPDHFLVSIDYAQIEVRVAAHVSGDRNLIDALSSGKDIHDQTSLRIFGDTEKEHRYAAKRVTFGVLYGISAKGLREQLTAEGLTGWTEDDCQKLIDEWFRVYPGVKRWIEETKRFVDRNLYVVDMFGRRRHIYEPLSVHSWIREEGYRKAVNFPIQSGAQGIIKEAMCRIEEVMPELQGVWPLLQIHDELLFEVHQNVLGIATNVLRALMETAVSLRVPLVCDVEIGKNWRDMQEAVVRTWEA